MYLVINVNYLNIRLGFGSDISQQAGKVGRKLFEVIYKEYVFIFRSLTSFEIVTLF